MTNLSVNVTVMTIDGLDEIAMTFKLKFNLQVRALAVKRWTNELEDVGSNSAENRVLVRDWTQR